MEPSARLHRRDGILTGVFFYALIAKLDLPRNWPGSVYAKRALCIDLFLLRRLSKRNQLLCER